MLGKELNSKWKVIEKVQRIFPEDSGGWFSISYIVESLDSSKKKAFLKALNYSEAFNKPNSADEINKMTTAFIYERNILQLNCAICI